MGLDQNSGFGSKQRRAEQIMLGYDYSYSQTFSLSDIFLCGNLDC